MDDPIKAALAEAERAGVSVDIALPTDRTSIWRIWIDKDGNVRREEVKPEDFFKQAAREGGG